MTADSRSITTLQNEPSGRSPSVERTGYSPVPEAGDERAAAIYSVIEPIMMRGLGPQAYIADVIARIAADWPASRRDELIVWEWRPAAEHYLAQEA